MSLTSMNIDEMKDPSVTISMKIHANQAPATSLICENPCKSSPCHHANQAPVTSFVYVFVVVNVVNVL